MRSKLTSPMLSKPATARRGVDRLEGHSRQVSRSSAAKSRTGLRLRPLVLGRRAQNTGRRTLTPAGLGCEALSLEASSDT